MRRSNTLLLGAAGILIGALSLALGTGVAWASGPGSHGSGNSDQPPGNNGTVKIDQLSMDPGQDQDPHVACGFSVNFYGYDGGPQTATINVTPVAPTSGGHTYSTTTSWDVGTRTSGNQFDRSVSVTGTDMASALSGVTPQAQQGYHLRLEVEVTGSQGSDDKYKVFWMAPCSTSPGSGPISVPESTTTTSTTTAPTTTTLPAGQVVTPAVPSTTTTTAARVSATLSPRTSPASGSSSGSSSAATPAPLDSLSAADSAPVPVASVSRPSHAGGFLAFTGVYVAALAALGLGLIAVGILLTLRWRRTTA